MKRETITELLNGITEDAEQVKTITDAIMAENGRDIEKTKGDVSAVEAERDALKEQLEEVNSKLSEFAEVDPEALNGKIKELTDALAAKDEEYKGKIADMEFSQTVTQYINQAGGKSERAIRALLDIDALKASKNQAADIEEAIGKLKMDADYLFKSDEPINNPSAPTGGGTDTHTDALRAAMGLPPEN